MSALPAAPIRDTPLITCPNCQDTLTPRLDGDHHGCTKCAFYDYAYTPPPLPRSKSLVSRGTLVRVHYAGKSLSMSNVVMTLEFRRSTNEQGYQRVTDSPLCPFCQRSMWYTSTANRTNKSGKTYRFMCGNKHQIHVGQQADGELYWK